MSLSPNLPASAIETVLAFLLPLILPTINNDTAAATALAIHMLRDYDPRTARELRLAAEAIGYSLKGLTVLAESAEPGIKAEKREADIKWACSLTRSGHQSERRLSQAQRAARATLPDQSAPVAVNESQATTGEPAAPASEPPAQHQPNDTQPQDVPTAEAALAKATKLLNLMKAHHKGAPPPHSQAAQQIQAQQRIVDTARLKLEQARRQQSAAAQAERAA